MRKYNKTLLKILKLNNKILLNKTLLLVITLCYNLITNLCYLNKIKVLMIEIVFNKVYQPNFWKDLILKMKLIKKSIFLVVFSWKNR